jgi:hypothetical protein
MTDMKKKVYPKFTSPKGVFVYPKLSEPDYKFKTEGEFSVKLKLTAEQAQPLITLLTPLYEAAIAEGQIKFDTLPVASRKKLKALTENAFYTEVYDPDTEEPTGEVLFKFANTYMKKNKKTGKTWTFSPRVFDAKGTPMVPVPDIWSGSVGKINFEVSDYFNAAAGAAGLSLRLNAAQVIELVAGAGGGNAAGFGFEEEEGFEYTAEEKAAASTAGGDEDEVDF